MTASLVAEPLLPLAGALLLLALLIAPAGLAARDRRWRLAASRLSVALVAGLLLINPARIIERRSARPDEAVLIVDRSPSMRLERRAAQVAKASNALTARKDPLLTWRIQELRDTPTGGTALAPAVQRALRQVSPDRLAGIVIASDGWANDVDALEALPPLDRPVHLLLAGARQRQERRLVVEQAPVYAAMNGQARLRFRIDGGEKGAPVRVDWSIDGVAQAPVSAPTGLPMELDVPIRHRGRIDVALSAAAAPGELVTIDNQALVAINGVREKLTVLLISGTPGLSGRLWRDMLKSDPNLTLVHFTILRFPNSFDPTPTSELSLIPFPVEQLFEERLKDFDLIILDRFDQLELIPDRYMASVADYVTSGGALLVAAGSELARAPSLAQTALGPLLPVGITGGVNIMPYRPALTPAGRIHPVTAGLGDGWGGGADWGRWEVSVGARARRGDTLMMDAVGRPLLVLATAGKGRIATLLSADIWRWARGLDGGGPRDELLRRLAHWLMREPELEDTRLEAGISGRRIHVTVRGLRPPTLLTVGGPDGTRSVLPLHPAGAGAAEAQVDVSRDGLHLLSAGGQSRVVEVGDRVEYGMPPERLARLIAWTRKSGGSVQWLDEGQPATRRVEPEAQRSGPGWIGLVVNHSGRLLDVSRQPAVPPLVAWLLMAAAVAAAWRYERAR